MELQGGKEMVIDTNMYWLPESLFINEQELNEFLEEIKKATDDTKGIVSSTQDGRKQIMIEKPEGYQNLNYGQGEYQIENQLTDLDEAAVDQAILKLPGCAEWMSLKTCKRFNNLMAEHVKKSNGRLIPLGVVPPFSKKENIEELKRCFDELGFHGVQIASHYQDAYLDDDRYSDFFALCNEYHATIYVHHSPVPVEYEKLYEFNNLRRSYGRCVDQTTAIGRELFSGFFDRYPNIKMIHSMLGGGFFAIANMLLPQPVKENENIKRFESNEHIREQFKKQVFFEMSHAQPWGKDVLECAIKILGADHILFGTSYPVRKQWLVEGPAMIESLEITQEEKEMILFKNAQRLYKIEE